MCPSLAEHWSEGNYIPEGDHHVAVASVRFFRYNTGSDGAEYTVTDRNGRKLRVAFSRLPQALWKLAQFAAACGMTKEQGRDFETESLASHEGLIGKELMVRVAKRPGRDSDKEYCEAVEWWRLADEPPAQAAVTPQSQPATRPATQPGARPPMAPPGPNDPPAGPGIDTLRKQLREAEAAAGMTPKGEYDDDIPF